MQPFLEALEQLRHLDPRTAFAQITRFFETINRMNKETVIAAWQAFRLYCRQTGQENLDDAGLKAVWDSLIGRMSVLAAEVPFNRRSAVVRAFCAATGLSFSIFWKVTIPRKGWLS